MTPDRGAEVEGRKLISLTQKRDDRAFCHSLPTGNGLPNEHKSRRPVKLRDRLPSSQLPVESFDRKETLTKLLTCELF